MTDAYSQKRDTPLDTYKAPPTYNPRMISYNLNSNVSNVSSEKLTYKQVVSTTKILPNESTNVIQPTYTEIDWKAHMENIRKETLDACKQMTQELIVRNNEKITKDLNDKINQEARHHDQNMDKLLEMMVQFQ